MTFWIVEVGEGFAAFEGEPGGHILNPMGTVHGGWTMTLIDSVTACAALLHDAGYIQEEHDTEGAGSKYTVTHIRRSMDFMERYGSAFGFTCD